MSTPTTEQQSAVEAAVREIAHIATLPEITVRIIELVEDPTSTAQDLRTVIENDPALCARVLKVVNSSFYGTPGQVESIERAIVLLGLNAVKNIAISASLTKLFKGGEVAPGFSAKELWVHCVATATAAKRLAMELGMALTDQAFLAGLIHDVGLMVELQVDRSKLIDVVSELGSPPQKDIRALEAKIFGANHEQFGAGLCKKWKFPNSLVEVVGKHHEPLEAEENCKQLALLVHAAEKLAARASLGFSGDVFNQQIGAAEQEALGLTPEQLETILEELPDLVEEIQALLS
ncbi:MAG: HDOD domain-containing protein [Planctomycetota bacterium]